MTQGRSSRWIARYPLLVIAAVMLALVVAGSGGMVANSHPRELLRTGWWVLGGVALATAVMTYWRARAGLDAGHVAASIWMAGPLALVGYLARMALGAAGRAATTHSAAEVLRDPDYFAAAIVASFSLWIALSVAIVLGWIAGWAAERLAGPRAESPPLFETPGDTRDGSAPHEDLDR